MAIRKIAQIGHPVLRQRAREVSREELASPATQQFIDDLIETMHDANGAGLAAIQVYEPIRICGDRGEEQPALPVQAADPAHRAGEPGADAARRRAFDNYEGCLSVPNLRGVVARAVHVRVTAWDRHGQPIDVWSTASRPRPTSTRSITSTRRVPRSGDRPVDAHHLGVPSSMRYHKAAFFELVARVGS
jgi:peptide deformylase